MGITSLLGPVLFIVVTVDGLNPCLSSDACTPGVNVLRAARCGITDNDIPDLVACLDTIGRSAIDTLELESNELVSLPPDLFDGLVNTVRLSLTRNALVTLPAGLFKSMATLDELTLDENRLKTLPSGLFDGLKNVHYLTLEDNRITSLPEDLFSGTPELHSLFLGRNALSTLPENIFYGTSALITLLVENNSINTLPGGLFERTPALNELDLSDNKLTTLPAGLFKGLTSMDRLTIFDNDIATLPTDIFDDMSSLSFLQMFRNQLTTLPAGLFDGLTALETLSLSQNVGLQCIPSTNDFTSVAPELSEFGAPPLCECPEFPTCDENGAACYCQSGDEGYSCAVSSSRLVRAFECPSSALVDAAERTTVTVEASAFDKRTSSSGCSPSGCTPENTRDNSLDANSRWSCKGDLVDGDEGCCIKYFFDEPQDIVKMNIAFHRGTQRRRTLNLFDNGDFHSDIVSSGSTNEFQEFSLDSDETADLTICLDDSLSGSEWLSITEVQFLVN